MISLLGNQSGKCAVPGLVPLLVSVAFAADDFVWGPRRCYRGRED